MIFGFFSIDIIDSFAKLNDLLNTNMKKSENRINRLAAACLSAVSI